MKKLFAMLLALCMVCGAVSVGAEETEEALKTIRLGNMYFDVPLSCWVRDEDKDANEKGYAYTPARAPATEKGQEMGFFVITYDYSKTDLDISQFDGDVDKANLDHMLLNHGARGNEELKNRLLEYAEVYSEMPNGRKVMVVFVNTGSYVSYYDQGIGCLLYSTYGGDFIVSGIRSRREDARRLLLDIVETARVEGTSEDETLVDN